MTLRSTIAAFCCGLVIACAHGGTLDDIRSRGVIRIATTLDYRPFSYLDGSTRAGIDVDLGRRLADTLGAEIRWIETSWPTLLDDLEAGRFDVAMSGISITPARSAAGLFANAYFHTGKSVLTRCALRDRFRSIEDIDRPDVTVIVNPGGTNEAFVRSRLQRARILAFPDNLGIFAALARGEADLMITDAVEAELESRREPALCHDLEPPYLEPVDKAWLIPADTAWKNWLDDWLAALERSGALKALVAHHLEASAQRLAQ